MQHTDGISERPDRGSEGRFSGRVSDYVRYRPDYPEEVVREILRRTSTPKGASAADIGSGTGIFTRLLLEAGLRVSGVEPNAQMRQAAEALLTGWAGFASRDGTADATGLPDRSVSLVTAAQAFHWFDPPPTREEFRRILVPGGWVVLLWNDRRLTGTPFLEEYESLLVEHGVDYTAVDHKRVDGERITSFFQNERWQRFQVSNAQVLDGDGLLGRVNSCSYVPAPDHPGFAPMQEAFRDLFVRSADGGVVRIEYDVDVYLGQL
jgi:SAM-dependent methyltransferase